MARDPAQANGLSALCVDRGEVHRRHARDTVLGVPGLRLRLDHDAVRRGQRLTHRTRTSQRGVRVLVSVTTASMCVVCGNMSTGCTRSTRYPAPTMAGNSAARASGLQEM